LQFSVPSRARPRRAAGAERGAAATSRCGTRRVRFATRRRLIAAFSTVLAAFVCALAVQVVTLRRIEATCAAMGDQEEQMVVALQLEGAADEYRHEAELAMAHGALLPAYEAAHARMRDLTSALRARVREPEAIAFAEEIREAHAKLDALIREAVAPEARRQAPVVSAAERAYPLIALVGRNADAIVARLHRAVSSSRRVIMDHERTELAWMATLLAVTPLFVAAAVFYLSRSVARPLAVLSEGAAALAGGDLTKRIEIASADEFGALAADFNAMTVALRQHQDRLVASEKLAGIGRLAAGVAHEINNPLQVIIGYLSMRRDVADRKLAEQLAAIEEEAMRCKTIVDGLLELSRPAARFEPVDLRGLCEDVAGSLRVAVKPLPLRLRVEGTAVALGDGPRLRQVLYNLMKNAVEASGPSGEVAVALAPSGHGVGIAVRDSGPGVPAAARARLFEPFFTTKPAGTGLGLAVSRAIALAHGGDIDVEASASGGAVFTLRLPHIASERRG
jgi:two-component system NtrC family sensor kinase